MKRSIPVTFATIFVCTVVYPLIALAEEGTVKKQPTEKRSDQEQSTDVDKSQESPVEKPITWENVEFEKCKPILSPELQKEFLTFDAKIREGWLVLKCGSVPLTPTEKAMIGGCAINPSAEHKKEFFSLPPDARTGWLLQYCLTQNQRWQFDQCRQLLTIEEQADFLSQSPSMRSEWLGKFCSQPFAYGTCKPNLAPDDKKELLDLSPQYRWAYLQSFCNGTNQIYKKCKPILDTVKQEEFPKLSVKKQRPWLNLYCEEFTGASSQGFIQYSQSTATHSPKRDTQQQRWKPSGYRILAHTLFWPGFAQTAVCLPMAFWLRSKENEADDLLSDDPDVDYQDTLLFVSAIVGGVLMVSAIGCASSWSKEKEKRTQLSGTASFKQRRLLVLPSLSSQGMGLVYMREF